jgi:hypothetical protein
MGTLSQAFLPAAALFIQPIQAQPIVFRDGDFAAADWSPAPLVFTTVRFQ